MRRPSFLLMAGRLPGGSGRPSPLPCLGRPYGGGPDTWKDT
jgi:hypothetical protein